MFREQFSWFGGPKRYRFRMIAENGEIVAQSQSYTRKSSALATIKLIQAEASFAYAKDMTGEGASGDDC